MHTELDLHEYEQWLSSNVEDIHAVREKWSKAERETGVVWIPCQAIRCSSLAAAMMAPRIQGNHEEIPGERVKALLPGRCFQRAVATEDMVQEGDPLVGSEALELSSFIR